MAFSLRTVSIAILLVGLIFTIFSLLLSEGATNYNVGIDPGTQESWNVINQSYEEEYSRIQNQSDKIYEVTGSEILEGAFEGGSAVLQIIKAPFQSIQLGHKIINEFASVVGVPKVIITFFESMLFVSVIWLIVYNIRRYRADR